MSCSIHTEVFSESVFDRGHNGLPASPESPLDTEDNRIRTRCLR